MVVCSWVEHWLFGSLLVVWCLVRRDVLRGFPFGGGLMGWVGWNGLCGGWWVVGALLGPEGTGMGGPLFLGGFLVLVVLWGRPGFRTTWVFSGFGGALGLVSVCCLRTAQWTRASLWLSF